MNNKRGGGCEMGTPLAQLGGLGERCKLPQRGLHGAEPQPPTLFYYIMLKSLHKTACKNGNCIYFS